MKKKINNQLTIEYSVHELINGYKDIGDFTLIEKTCEKTEIHLLLSEEDIDKMASVLSDLLSLMKKSNYNKERVNNGLL